MTRAGLAFLILLAPLLLASTGAGAQPSAPALDLRGQYEAVMPPQPTQTPGKVEVVELFTYGCPHCYELEGPLKQWLARKPDYVAFTRMPAVFGNNRLWLVHAQAYYTADALGVLGRVHPAIFEAIHERRRPLDTRERLRTFFQEHGVAEADFDRAWDSFGVQSRIRQAASLTERYGIDGVPAVVVNGKYRTSGSLTGSFANLLRVIDTLAAQERAAVTGTPSTRVSP
jgi:thiol:disulfide interchange protein DsbA